ncbi:hypothetical protein [Leptolyngbya sp. BC1307]|uniref:hypothetical protein n=1 Tax=Leptolyngbya sp. BC1307 TaxID=2029589 RepID=UPI000EFC2B64|nr:hypothetical protein [Leptolyngbya sp. BC1307]
MGEFEAEQQSRRIAYEELLADCCHYEGMLSVLKLHRPYFEALPSVRRPQESMVTLPLPNIRSREVAEMGGVIDTSYRIRPLPCDVALMMCDPEWKIKTGIEIVLFIQRPGEDLSDVLSRWRQTQVELGQGVEWLMPRRHKHLLAEGTETPHPLFVVFTPEVGEIFAPEARIIRGLTGAGWPVVQWAIAPSSDSAQTDSAQTDSAQTDDVST